MPKIRERFILPRIKRKSALFITALLPFVSASAALAQSTTLISAPLNPEFVKYQNALKKGLVKAISPSGHSLGALPSPLDLSQDIGKKPIQKFIPVGYEVSYDMRSFGKVSTVKDQGQCGACWTFATMAVLESRLLTGESWDFSENNLKNTSGFDSDPCAGGNNQMATAYLARLSGPWSEADDPYTETPGYYAPTYPSADRQKNIQEALFLPDRSGPIDNDNIKYALITYGAVYTAIYPDTGLESDADSNYYNAIHSAYYDYGTESPGHAVTIVGWDDTYSKTNFSATPPGNGAFIIKNSWGTTWGAGGYFYISYYDTNIKTSTVYPTVNDRTGYDWIYQYDPLGWTRSIGYGTTTGWFGNMFTASAGNTKVTDVGFYTTAMNATYTIRIYRGVTTTPNTGTLMSTKSGTIPYTGYHTVTLDTAVPLNSGQKFSVVVGLTTPGYNFPIPIEMPIAGYSSKATASAGQSYISPNGTTWDDLTNFYPNSNVTIKAFAINVVSTPENLAGTAMGVSSISWTWNTVPEATQYNFYPSTGGAATILATTGLIQNNLSTNTAYGARVSAATTLRESDLTAEVIRYTLAASPTGYRLLSAQDTSIAVQWGANGNPGGTQYQLDYWALGGSTASVQGTNTNATVGGLTASTTYYLRVYAKNGDNILAASTNTLIVQTLPIAPGNFSGAGQGVSSITWTWDSVVGATQYKFYPSTGGAAIGLASPTLTQIRLSTNTAYGGRVSVVNTSGESGLTATTTVYTLAAAPISATFVAVNISSVSTTWGMNQNPAGTFFTLEASANNFTSISASSRTALSTATILSLLPNTSYYFRAKAENGTGAFSNYTPIISTVTLANVPGSLALAQLSSASLHTVWQQNSNPADTQYELSCSSTNFTAAISTPVPFSINSAVIQADITGLLDSTTYYARVRARSRTGIRTVFVSTSMYLPPSLVQTINPAQEANMVFGNAALTIPSQSFAETIIVTLQSPASFPAPESYAASLSGLGAGISVTTDKELQPIKRLSLTLNYSPGQAAGMDESKFLIARYEPTRSVWVPYASTPNPAANQVTALIDHLSLFQIMMATPASSLSAATIKIFPNPVHPSKGQSLKFTGLPAGAQIKIYTFQGELVRELTADASGMAQWDVKNSANQVVASEVYLVFIKSGSDTKTLKVMVER